MLVRVNNYTTDTITSLYTGKLGDLDIQSVDGGGWKLVVLWTDFISNPNPADRPKMATDLMVSEGNLKTFSYDASSAKYLVKAGTPISKFKEIMVVNNNAVSKGAFGRYVILPIQSGSFAVTPQNGLPCRAEKAGVTKVWTPTLGWNQTPFQLKDETSLHLYQAFGLWTVPNNTGIFGGANTCANRAAASLIQATNPCHFDQTLVKGIFIR